MLQNTSFEALDFNIFRGSMPPDPSGAYKRLALPALMSINSLKIWRSPCLSIPGSAFTIPYD